MPDYSYDIRCPICDNPKTGFVQSHIEKGHTYFYDCSNCGKFLMNSFDGENFKDRPKDTLSDSQRAMLSYLVRHKIDMSFQEGFGVTVDSECFSKIEDNSFVWPGVSQKVRHILRFTANRARSMDSSDPNTRDMRALIATLDPMDVENLLNDMQARGWVAFQPFGTKESPNNTQLTGLRLTLSGSEKWESIQKETSIKPVGFIAMQFGDNNLDEIVKTNIQGKVSASLGYPINRVDSPEVSQAGIIDNIMREAIADSDFVLADLTHGNKGAYWEAGYAEGLGKPVIYLCEKEAFEKEKPHFDVNHSTIVMWDRDNLEDFEDKLIACIKNSLRKSMSS